MLCGVVVLALPLIVIGNAFEETVKEEERYKRERAKRIEIKKLERFGGGNELANQVRGPLTSSSFVLWAYALMRLLT